MRRNCMRKNPAMQGCIGIYGIDGIAILLEFLWRLMGEFINGNAVELTHSNAAAPILRRVFWLYASFVCRADGMADEFSA